jgi:hypothetical protein
MSVTVDFVSAITAAKARVASANGRNAAGRRRKRGVSDPRVADAYRSELTTAVIACDIITNLAKWPDLTVPQRLELIDLLMPSDSAAVDHIISQLRDLADTALLAYGGGHGST